LYTRNKFRNEIIPQIEQSFPAFKSSILRLASNLKSTEAYLNHHLEEDKKTLLQKVGEDCYQVDLSKLLAWGESVPYLLHELFSPFGFNPSALEDLFRTLSEKKSGRIFYSKDRRYTLVKNTESVELFPSAATEEEEFQIPSIEELSHLPIPLKVEKKDRGAVQFQKGARVCYIDEAKLRFPLTMRHWREGDRFSPLGMAGKMKKVSDFFIDKKIREHEKQQIWMLTSGAGASETVVWIVGHRSDERFKVDEKTEKVVVLTLQT
jgi:tRNA(Ile)-lysidine synthase